MSKNLHQYDGQINLASVITDAGYRDIGSEIMKLSLFENMFEPCLSGTVAVRDMEGWAESIDLRAGAFLMLEFNTPSSTSEGFRTFCCNMRVTSVTQVPLDGTPTGVMQGKSYILNFCDASFAEGNYDLSHLEIRDTEEDDSYENSEVKPVNPKYYKGKISDFLKKILESNSVLSGPEEHNIEETGNNIYYVPDQGDYSVLRKDGEQRPFELISQLAENAIHKDNPNAVNFYFWQSINKKWNFRSIESLIKNKPDNISTYYGGPPVGDSTGRKDRIVGLVNVRYNDLLSLQNNGGLASTMNFYRPKPDVEKYKIWYNGDIDTVYFKVNCRVKDHFPAALFGFQQIEKGFAEWRYAWAEVYLTFDYTNNRPMWSIKPIERGGLRSWVVHEIDEDNPEDGVVPFVINGDYSDVDIFARPAFNTMEIGNDSYYDYEKRRGWEAPGYRLDTELWEESCMKIQPIRGSFCVNEAIEPKDDEPKMKNNVIELWAKCFDTFESITTLLDDFSALGSFPIVDIKIYYGDNEEPHYFFTAENAVDGECDEENIEPGEGEEEGTEDCKDEVDSSSEEEGEEGEEGTDGEGEEDTGGEGEVEG